MKKLILFISLLISTNSFCIGFRGADLTYTVNGLNVTFRVVTYQDSTLMVLGNLAMNSGSGNNFFIYSTNGIVNNGIRVTAYEGSRNYPAPGNYLVQVYLGNRVPGIANIPGSMNEPMCISVEITISSFFPYSYSPLFTEDHFNISINNDTIFHDPGIMDPDGDSLSIEFLKCLGDQCDTVGLYSFPSQMGGFEQLDSNGILSYFMPFQSMMSFAIKATKWRNGVALCSSYRDILIENYFLGMGETEILSHFSIFPNPTLYNSLMRFESLQTKESKLEIFTITGEKVFSKNIFISKGKNELEINTTEISPGIYFVKIAETTIFQKLVVQ